MKCPNDDCRRKIQVSDSRERRNGLVVKRRRKCNNCKKTYTTYEVIQFEDVDHPCVGVSTKVVDYTSSFNEIRRHLDLLEKSIGSSINVKL